MKVFLERLHQESRGARKHPERSASLKTISHISRRILAVITRHQQYLPLDLGPYRYTTIDKEASEIRLMTILPGAFGSEVRITIQNHVITESHIPVYEALSYAWGSNERSLKIRIEETDGDRTLDVTSILAEALQHLRYENKPRVLWIDAICVDQQNIPERGHQVSRMADIYRSASPVLIWLGPEFASSDVAMRELSALGSTVRINWGITELIPLSGESYPVWQATPLPLSKHDSVLRSIENLLDRLWFKRLWIWQEVRLAKIGTQMLCGDKIMPWETFRNAMWCFRSKYDGWGNNLLDLTNQISDLCNYDGPQSYIFDILEDTKSCKYSDPRDRIYAILNLTYPHEIRGLDADYSQSTEEVFRTLVVNYTSTSGALELLSQCEMKELKAVKIASWVPDWTVPSECERLQSVACWGSKAEASFDDVGILRVTALCVGIVDSVHDVGDQELSSVARRLWRALGQEEDMGVADDSNIDALCRTLCGNDFCETYLPPLQGRPRLQESQAYMLNLLKDNAGPIYKDYIVFFRHYTKNRVFFTSKEGDIGLAPRRTELGDILCIVLGCHSPLVFRANEVGKYTVVGECYLDGFMDGAGLLGMLPKPWQRVTRYNLDLKDEHVAFIDRDTGTVQVEDPRLGPPPPGWRIADHRYKHVYNTYTNEAAGVFESDFDPRMTPEALKARGIDLQEYRLV